MLLFFGCKKNDDDECQPTCPTGYTGCQCETTMVPTYIVITKVELLTYPVNNNGKPWDDFSPWADPYFSISNPNSTFFTSEYRTDVNPNTQIAEWVVDVQLLAPNQVGYVIQFYDFDSAADDTRITGDIINPNTNVGFPKSVTFNTDGCTFVIYYEYFF